jgi:hypothetical protein
MTRRIAISTRDHAEKGWLPVRGYEFARDRAVVPLAFDELTRAASHFVLGFIKPKDTYQLVALLGPGQNAYVHPGDGRWLGAYVPAKLRGEPFELGFTEENPNQPILCIDPSHLVEHDADGAEALFDEQGQLQGKSAEVLSFLHQRLKGTLVADKVTEGLTELLEPWPLRLPRGGQDQTMGGFYRVNEQALKSLSPERLAELNQRQGLALAYAQLISTGHIAELVKRCEMIDQFNSDVPETLDAVFGEGDEELSFDFDS